MSIRYYVRDHHLFVNNVPTGIKAHIRHIIIHDESDNLNQTRDHILEFTDGSHLPILAWCRVGEPSADWTNYISARKVFYSALVDGPFILLPFHETGHDMYSKRDQQADWLFKTAWLLAQTFTAARKSVYINSWRHNSVFRSYMLMRVNTKRLSTTM